MTYFVVVVVVVIVRVTIFEKAPSFQIGSG